MLLSRVQLLSAPSTVALQTPLSIEFPRQDYWSGLLFPPPKDLPNPGIKPTSLPLAGGFFTTAPVGKPIQVTRSTLLLLSHVQRFVTPWTTACQAFLSFTISHSLLKHMPSKSVMPSNHFILC